MHSLNTSLVMYSSSLLIKTHFLIANVMQSTVIHVYIFPRKTSAN